MQNSFPSELPLRDIHLPDPISWWPPALGWLVSPWNFAVFHFFGGDDFKKMVQAQFKKRGIQRIDQN